MKNTRTIRNLFHAVGMTLMLLAVPAMAATATGEGKSGPSEAVWSENFQEAQAKAKATGRPMLLLFTGSDWCPPCMQLERRVFSSEPFARFAEKEVVLMKADFPRGKQDEAVARQNAALQQRFPIRGYPTVFLLDPDSGQVIYSTGGYGGQSPEQYIQALQTALKQG